MQQLGIIDLGSNTARMVVMQYQPHHSFKLVDEVQENVRLAHAVGDDNTLQPEPIEIALETLHMFASLGKALNVDQIVAVATSAVRDAANQAEFLTRVRDVTGLDMRVLSGEEEAYYGYLGVINSLDFSNGFVFDIGGGSVELSLVRGRGLVHSTSLPLGTVRLTERFFNGDTPTKAELKKLQKYLDNVLNDVAWFAPQPTMHLVGVGGTVRNLAKMDQAMQNYPLDKLHGYEIPYERVDMIATRLAKMSRSQRENLTGLNRDRADVIVAGVWLIRVLMQRSGASCLRVSGQGLRDGLFYEHFLAGSQPPITPNLRQLSVQNLAHLYNYHAIHAQKVCDLSLTMFDQLHALHGYGAWERELLASAAILHDIGVSINYYDHHKHSLYLILNAGLNGFNHRELVLIGLLTRFHRKGNVIDEGLGALLQSDDLDRVAKLAALLRIAEYLERAKSQVIQTVSCRIEKQRVIIEATSVGDATVEIWDANRRTSLFRKAYGMEIEIVELGS